MAEIPDIQRLIVTCLTDMRDILKFRSICQRWKKYIEEIKDVRIQKIPKMVRISKILPKVEYIDGTIEFDSLDEIPSKLRYGTLNTILCSNPVPVMEWMTKRLKHSTVEEITFNLCATGRINILNVDPTLLEITFSSHDFLNFNDTVNQLITAYAGAFKKPIKVSIDRSVFDLPFELIDELNIQCMTNEDWRDYKKLVDKGRLKQATGYVEAVDLLYVSYPMLIIRGDQSSELECIPDDD